MGAVIIGIGIAIAAIGFLLGAIGFGSSETTSGAALFTVGSIVFVGGLVVFALGFVHRAVMDVANKLDGVLHFEPDEEPASFTHAAEPVRHDVLARDEEPDLPSLSPQIDEDVPAAEPPFVRRDPPSPAARSFPPAAPIPPAAVSEVALPVEEKPASTGLGMPSWFRRKQEAEAAPQVEDDVPSVAAEPEPPVVETPPPLTSDTLRREVPSFLRDGRASEPRSSEPRGAEPRLFEGRGLGAERGPAPAFGDDSFETRAPRPRPEPPMFSSPFTSAPSPAAEPAADETPGFLNVSDLLEDPVEEPQEPSVTLLKAGVIGGMAYKLYSDGSIEADLPDGTLRFASLQELRDHVSASTPRGEG